MKSTKYIITAAMACGALLMPSCDENSWNNDLDGFEEFEKEPITQVETVEYTLAESAYSSIAGLSSNKALAGEEGADALAAVGSLKRFSADAPASKYVPAWLASTNFPYYALDNGSTVKLTYNVAVDEPAHYAAASAPATFSVKSDMYEMDVWGADGSEDWVDCFTPSKPASEYLPTIIEDYIGGEEGKVCVVSYRQSIQEPVFGGGAEAAPAEPEEVFAQTFTEALEPFTVENPVLPEQLSFVWTWGGANYGAKASAFKDGVSYPTESWLISPAIDLSRYTEPVLTFEHVVNKFPDLDFAKANCTLWARVAGSTSWTQVTIPQYTDNTSWAFGPSGEISLAAYAGKKIELGFKYVSEQDKSGTWEVKNLVIKGLRSSRASRAKYDIPYTQYNALYLYSNDGWAPLTNGFVVLNPSDYTDMGQKYANLSAAEPYLSKYLKVKLPYASADDIECVVWNKYSGGAAAYTCSAYKFDGTEWHAYNFTESETSQFVRFEGNWMFDPNVTITLPAGRNQDLSTLYYQTCVQWVFDNICKPLGDTSLKSGLYYVTSYGNNEYYSGTSAYQGNVDLRPQSARDQYAAGYEGMSDDEIIELEKQRFMNEVMPGALSILHADAAPIEGMEVLYTINFSAYFADRTTKEYTAVFRVVAPGKFEPVSCTWWDAK